MGMTIDDSVKQKLLDSLAEEPTMVLSTAYAYAKNYVKYGEDITKEWTTAVQQVSVIQKARQEAWVEAYDYFKKDYDKCLKADMAAMLTDIYLSILEIDMDDDAHNSHYRQGFRTAKNMSTEVIQKKINSLKENTDGTNSD